MVSFKSWLYVYEAAFPKPITLFGKQVGSEEEFNAVAKDDYKAHGLDDEQIDRLKKDVDNDILHEPPHKLWSPFSDPNFELINDIVKKIIPKNSHRQTLYRTVEEDPIANILFKKLFHHNVTEKDVANFVDQMEEIGIYKPQEFPNDLIEPTNIKVDFEPRQTNRGVAK